MLVFFPRKLLILLPILLSCSFVFESSCSKQELTVKQSIFYSNWAWRKKRAWWVINIHSASRIYSVWWSIFCSLLSIVAFLILPSISHVIEAFLGRGPALPQELSFVVADTPTQASEYCGLILNVMKIFHCCIYNRHWGILVNKDPAGHAGCKLVTPEE